MECLDTIIDEIADRNYRYFVFVEDEERNRKKRIEKYMEVSAVVDVRCGDTKEFV